MYLRSGEIRSALDALFEDVLPPEAEPRYDCDGAPYPALSLMPDGGILEHHGPGIRPMLAEHTDEELERGARLLLLRAARRVRPEEVRAYFDEWDLPEQHTLEIPEFLVGGGLDIERGDALLVMADPNFLGLVARRGPLSTVLVFNTPAVVRLDPNAPAFPRRPIRPRPPVPLESQAKRLARLRIERRARALLFQYLAREQKWELRAYRRVTVTGQDGRIYRIYAWQGMNVRLVEDGKETHSLCVVPNPEVATLPIHDLILAQKVLLESHVEHFLKTAITRTIRP